MVLDIPLLKETTASFGLPLDDALCARFLLFTEHLLAYNQRVNLTSITAPDAFAVKHIADSLTLLPVLQQAFSAKNSPAATAFNEKVSGEDLPIAQVLQEEQKPLSHKAEQSLGITTSFTEFSCAPSFSAPLRGIDVGTGGGFPGLPLLLACPSLTITLLDSTRKKLAFVQSMLTEFSLSGSVLHARAEEAARLQEHRAQYDFCVSRAVAGLPQLSELCLPFVRKGGVFIAMKGAPAAAAAELEAAKPVIARLGGAVEKEIPLTFGPYGERTLLVIRKLSQISPEVPPSSAKNAKRKRR